MYSFLNKSHAQVTKTVDDKMASGSSATSPQSSTSNLSSRFSSLKVFKFSKGNDNRTPPPPPPKDEYYLRNRSLASLLPDNQSLAPSSPMSPELPYQFTAQRSPEANQSTMSLASSAASGFSSPPVESKSRPQSRGKERALAFLKFGKRSPRSPSTSRKESVEGEPQPDEGISTPFNFQHNIHVNDELTGMPPSWSTSLAQHGFSEEEIAMLQSRRAESRSPSTQKLFNLRPSSPTIPHPYQPNPSPPGGVSTVPTIANPAPRTTSLPRQYSDASLRSGFQSNQQRPPLPFSQTSASMSTSSLHSSKAPSVSSRLVPQRHPNSQSHHGSQLSMSHSSDSNHSGSGKEDSVALTSFTPQRKAPSPGDPRGKSHTTNESISSSIYPSTSSFNGHQRTESNGKKRLFGSQPDTRVPPTLPSIPSTSARPSNTSSSTTNNTTPPFLPPLGGPSIQAKRAPGSAPRLSISLHNHTDSSDLSSWAGALFENLASGDLDGKFSPTTHPTSPQSAPATAAFKPMNLQPNRRQPSPPSPLAPSVKVLNPDPPAPEAPVRSLSSPVVQSKGLNQSPPPPLEEREELGQDAYMSPPYTADSLGSSSSPLWSQLEGMLGQSVSVHPPDEDDHGPYSAALAEQFSPTLPFSPEEERMAAQRRLRTETRAKDALGREDEDYRLSVNTVRPNRDSARSSTSTIAAAAVVRHVSIIRRAGAFVIDNSKARASRAGPAGPPPTSSLPTPPTLSEERFPPSPSSPAFDIDAEYGEQSGSPLSSAQSQAAPTPTTGNDLTSPLNYYLNPSPSPSQTTFSVLQPKTSDFNDHPEDVWDDDEDYEEGDETGASLVVPPHVTTTSPSPARPTIVITDQVSQGGGLTVPLPSGTPSGTPSSPFERYRGWQSEVVAPLEEFIDDQVDPHDHYLDLKEIAEGESGSVYSARLTHKDAGRLRLPALVKAKDTEDIANGREILVAIKSVAILPSGSQKLNDLRHELTLMRGLSHENLISLDALYVDLLEDTLWIRMELMERSLADVIALVDNGLILQDRTMARFASDILKGLEYLQSHNIAHRDIRSDNLLLNTKGVLKITDFANARQVSEENPMLEDPAGVLYWQAPEVRSPPYNALKVDVWSLGATVWEMAETQPPFADTNQFAERWPSVSRPEMHSPAFHDFLLLCSEPAATRPSAAELLNQSSFIKNACGRPVIVQLLAQCTTIESSLQ